MRCRAAANNDAMKIVYDEEWRAVEHLNSHQAVAKSDAESQRSSPVHLCLEQSTSVPLVLSSTVWRFRHLETVFALMPGSRLSSAFKAWDCCIVARMACAAVTYLSHMASFHLIEWIAPSNRRVKHLDRNVEKYIGE